MVWFPCCGSAENCDPLECGTHQGAEFEVDITGWINDGCGDCIHFANDLFVLTYDKFLASGYCRCFFSYELSDQCAAGTVYQIQLIFNYNPTTAKFWWEVISYWKDIGIFNYKTAKYTSAESDTIHDWDNFSESVDNNYEDEAGNPVCSFLAVHFDIERSN